MAKLARETVLAHLNRIYANGAFGEGVVVKQDLSCFAKTEDGKFYLTAPGLGVKVLPEPMGLMELDRVIAALRTYAVEEEIEPRLEDVDGELVKGTYFILDIDNPDVKRYRRLMTDKDVPTSRVSDDKAKLVANAVAAATKAGRVATIKGMSAVNLLRAMSVVPAEWTQLTAHLKGLFIQIGTRFNNLESAKYALQTSIKPDVVFQVQSKHLIAALEQIPEDGEALLSFTDQPEPIVGVQITSDAGEYIYAMGSTVPATARA